MKVLASWFLAVLVLVMPFSALSGPRINDLKQQVQQSKKELRLTRKKWYQAQQALKQLEGKLASSARALAKIEDSIIRNQRSIRAKKRDLVANKKQLNKRIKELSRSLRGIEQWINEPALKWILSSNDPGDWSRLATYHHIIGHSQQQLITELKELQQRILRDEQALEKLAQSLKKGRQKHRQHLAKLRDLKNAREQLVAKLQLSVRDKSRQLARDKSQLQSMLTNLGRYGQRFGGHFAKLKGKLIWPIKGHLQQLFNHAIQGSELKWSGTLFEAPQDRLVKAVAPGRVVYADWMSGYGWLLIIEHDHGYMTLYGRNHYLYKKVGQAVRGGEIIARSGKSGGFRQPALYFSLRHNAIPLNPSEWLARKQAA